MRVLILGIDALEYNLVEEWDLKYLKQKEYGKMIRNRTRNRSLVSIRKFSLAENF